MEDSTSTIAGAAIRVVEETLQVKWETVVGVTRVTIVTTEVEAAGRIR